MTSIKVDIINGPSKFDLMLALFDSRENRGDMEGYGRQIVELVVGDVKFPRTLKAIVNSVAIDENRPQEENWIISGSIGIFGDHVKPVRFMGHFNSHTRKGWLEVENYRFAKWYHLVD